MGLKVGTVKLEKYNSLWKEEFIKEKENLEKIFNDLALSIEHVGSTSIKGLSSKPIIDILVGIDKLNDFEKVRPKFLNNPEYSIKEDSPLDDWIVRKGSENNRTHFIHIVEIDSYNYKNTLLFRDYLRNNPDELKNYENLKRSLAEKYHNDRRMYTTSKNDYILSVIEKAKNPN